MGIEFIAWLEILQNSFVLYTNLQKFWDQYDFSFVERMQYIYSARIHIHKCMLLNCYYNC